MGFSERIEGNDETRRLVSSTIPHGRRMSSEQRYQVTVNRQNKCVGEETLRFNLRV